jgi:dihydrofolate synthase/folylpolyglutamate synthase
LKESGFTISNEDMRVALSRVKQLTGLQGRWDILSEHPTVVAECGTQ